MVVSMGMVSIGWPEPEPVPAAGAELVDRLDVGVCIRASPHAAIRIRPPQLRSGTSASY
jgi:hypothetical protein